MLGFDALGRQALGQITNPAGSYTLTASAGAYAISGQAALFQSSLLSAAAAYAVAGNASIPYQAFPSSAGAFIVTGNAATLTRNTLWTEKTREDETWTEKVYSA